MEDVEISCDTCKWGVYDIELEEWYCECGNYEDFESCDVNYKNKFKENV